MALVGIIVGYGVATAGGSSAKPLPAAAPTPQAAPQAAQPTPEAPTAQSVVAPDSKNDHIKGSLKAEISLIEYSDFECPFCQRHHPTMQQALDEYDGTVNWVYRHYPLNFHPNAMPAALASECAAEIGGNDSFWSFSDLVFTKGSDPSNYPAYISEIGLDATAFQSCLTSGKYEDKVNAQLAEGSNSGVRGTPGTIVYNNKTKESRYISGAQPYANIKAAIDEIL